MSYKSGTNGTMLLLPGKQGIFYVPLLKTKVEQDFTHLPVLPDKLGKFYVPLFNSKSGTSHRETESRRGQYTAGGEISDTLPFFVVCRYFRRIYRLPRTLDTLDTLFSQSTLIEKTFPFSLSRISSKKGVSSVSDGCTPRWTREKYRHTIFSR